MRLTLALFLLAAPALTPQTARDKPQKDKPEEITTIQVDVDLVSVLCSVRDKRNGLVGNLQKEDFQVFEDGKAQEIKYFTRESDLPLTIGLLVDVSVSQERLIAEERIASLQFFRQVLRPKDMAFLISFGSEAELLQDYTNSATLLRKALDDLRVSSSGPPASIVVARPGPVPTASQPRGTVMFDAVYLAAADRLQKEVGRKAMVLITDGVDQGSRLKREEAIAAAHRADAIIYSIYYVDPGFYGGHGFYGPSGEGDLRRMSDDTGGRLFRVDRKHTLEDIYRELQQELRTQYSVSYTSTNPAKDGSFRKVEVRARNKELKVQARKGYYASKS